MNDLTLKQLTFVWNWPNTLYIWLLVGSIVDTDDPALQNQGTSNQNSDYARMYFHSLSNT